MQIFITWNYVAFLVYMTLQTNGEENAGYSVTSLHCEDPGNCVIKRNRMCTLPLPNGEWTPRFLCKENLFYEELTGCYKFEYTNDYCSGGYKFVRFLQECDGKCSNRIEKHLYQCTSNPSCTMEQHRHCKCDGDVLPWGEWSPYGACSATCGGGKKTRTRHSCFDREKKDPSTDCGTTEHTQTWTEQCNTFPCTWIKTTTTTPPKAGVGEKSLVLTTDDCDKVCETTPKTTPPDAIYSECDDARIRSGSDLTGECRSEEKGFIVSCNDRHICSEYSGTLKCTEYQEWSEWSDWKRNADRIRGDSGEHRTRHRWCGHAFTSKRIENLSCQRTISIQTDCRESLPVGASTEPPDGKTPIAPAHSGMPWLLPVIIVLVCVALLACCCCLWFFCMSRKHRKKRNNSPENPSIYAVASDNHDEDNVFVVGGNAGAPTDGRARMTSPNRLGVMDRIRRISEHVYEAISMQGTRLFSRSSTADEGAAPTRHRKNSANARMDHILLPRRSPDKVQNEYVSDEEDMVRKLASSPISRPALMPSSIQNGKTAAKRDSKEKDNVLRVSVMVTDPEGREVVPPEAEGARTMGDRESQSSAPLPAPPRFTSDYVSMNKDRQSTVVDRNPKEASATQRKKQWERIPSPKSRDGVSPARSKQQSDNESKEGTPGKKGIKMGLMNMLQNMKKKEKEEKPEYDNVTRDVTSRDPPDGDIYIPSAPPSVSDSMWSDSTFESIDFSDREDPESPDPRMLAVEYKSRKRTGKKPGGKRSRKPSARRDTMSSAPLLGPDDLPPPPDDLIAPGMNVTPAGYLTPNQNRIASVQYLSPRLIKPASTGQIALSPGNPDTMTYLHMNTDRSTVKSWLNLGPAPEPMDHISNPTGSPLRPYMHNHSNSNQSSAHSSPTAYCTANEVNQEALKAMNRRLHREKSLDEKYTTHGNLQNAPPSDPGRMSMRDLPQDGDGYFNLEFPNAPHKRINTIEAQKAVKKLIKAPVGK